MDSRFLLIFGILVLIAILEIVILGRADQRRRRAMFEAGTNQGFQPALAGNTSSIASVPILEHKRHTWGQVLQGNRGACEVLLFDYSYRVAKSSSNQTVAAFRLMTVSFPKFQLRKNSYLASAGWGAYQSNRVKFDVDPSFNKSYLVAGPDPQALEELFQAGLRQFLVSMSDRSWTIEAYGNWLIFYRHGKMVKPEALSEFVESAGRLADNIFALARETKSQ